MQYMIGMDIGTTSTKAVLYDQNGQIYAQANEGYELYRDATGMAEEDPAEILTASITTLATVVRTIDFTQNELKGISFSSANQSLLVLDQNHQPLTRLLTWADTRAAKYAEQIKNSARGQALYEKTGTPHHPMTLLAKISWLKAKKPALYARAAYYCGIKEYILYQLCGIWQMDISIASCTGLFNIFTQEWDPEALKLAGVNIKQLPPVVDAYAQFSGLKPEYVQQTGCPNDTTFVQGAFDGALSNLGVGALDEKTAAVTIGTSGAVRVMTDHPVTDPQGRLFCYALDRQRFVVGGPVNNGGVVFRWARDNLFDSEKSTAELLHQDSYDLVTKIADQVPAGANGLIFHPFLGGERAPLWNADARGSFFGLTQLHNRMHMARAVLEGIVYNLNSVLLALEEVVGKSQTILATGGFARSQFWCQLLADIFGRPVTIPQAFESSCLGAAVVGLKAVGLVQDFKVVTDLVGSTAVYQPNTANHAVYQELIPIYNQLTQQLSPLYGKIAQFQKKHAYD